MAAHMALKVNEKQAILETVDIAKRLENLMTLMEEKSIFLKWRKKFVSRSSSKWRRIKGILL